MSKTFNFSVNGKGVSVTLDNEETPLLNVLRNELGLMGTRYGCGLEQCGCCMVLVDGAPESAAPNRSGALREKRSSLSKAWVTRQSRTRCNRPLLIYKPANAATASQAY